MTAVETRATQLSERLKAISATIKTADFGMVIYDYSHAANRLVKIASAFSLKNDALMSDLERVFPALSGKAGRMLGESAREERAGISPIDLAGGESFLIVAVPGNVMVFGVKTPNLNLNHDLLGRMVRMVADVRDEKELLNEVFSEKVVDIRQRQASMAI